MLFQRLSVITHHVKNEFPFRIPADYISGLCQVIQWIDHMEIATNTY